MLVGVVRINGNIYRSFYAMIGLFSALLGDLGLSWIIGDLGLSRIISGF